MGEKDITEKTLASYNDVFSDIVNGLLFDGRPVVDPDALSDAAPYSMYKADGKVHEQERDDPNYVSTDRTAFVHTDEILKLMSLLTDDDRYELTLNSEGGKPKNMCEMLDRVEARGMEKGMAKGEDMIVALLKKLTPGSEDYNKVLNASPEERRELYKKYGIA